MLVTSEIRRSEKPMDLIFLRNISFTLNEFSFNFSSTFTIPNICSRNHLSHPVILEISSIGTLFLIAVDILKILSGTCSANQPDMISISSNISVLTGKGTSFKPDKPVSSDLRAFWRDS